MTWKIVDATTKHILLERSEPILVFKGTDFEKVITCLLVSIDDTKNYGVSAYAHSVEKEKALHFIQDIKEGIIAECS